jgi:hypothetical protein
MMERNWLIKILPPWEKRHAWLFAGVRYGAGCWLVALTAILYGYDRAGWWTPLLLVAAAAHFYLARRLQQLSGASEGRGA